MAVPYAENSLPVIHRLGGESLSSCTTNCLSKLRRVWEIGGANVYTLSGVCGGPCYPSFWEGGIRRCLEDQNHSCGQLFSLRCLQFGLTFSSCPSVTLGVVRARSRRCELSSNHEKFRTITGQYILDCLSLYYITVSNSLKQTMFTLFTTSSFEPAD